MKHPASHTEAVAQWENEVRRHIPGLKVSNLPCRFIVPVTLDAGRRTSDKKPASLWELVSELENWGHIPEALQASAEVVQKGWTPPEGWSYTAIAAQVAPGELPDPLDIPNPRLYTLEGWQAPRMALEGSMAREVVAWFKQTLSNYWHHEEHATPPAPFNERRSRVHALLDHHFSHGNNPGAFLDFIGTIARMPEGLPKPSTGQNFLREIGGLGMEPLNDPQGLASVLEAWIKNRQAENTDRTMAIPHQPKGQRQRLSPYVIQAHEEQAKDPAPFVPELSEGPAEELEAKALEQFEEARRGYFPGFAFSELPANFVVKLKRTKKGRANAVKQGKDPEGALWPWQRSAWKFIQDVKQWDKMRERLLEHPDPNVAPIIPKGWSYAKLVGDARPHRFDLKNPRLYTLDGRLVPWAVPDYPQLLGRYAGHMYGQFPERLVDVFLQAPPNDKAAEVSAFLEHHRTQGGNPQALADYVEGLLVSWKAEPPVRTFDILKGATPIPQHSILTRAMEQWLEEARKAPTSAKSTASAKAKPTASTRLRTLAERLDAKHGAREAFDTMLFIDGYTTEAGEWKLASRKGRAEVVAAWDAVVEIFGVEGYAKEEKSDKALSSALREYIPGLTISERPNKLRNTSKRSTYTKARASCERYLKERRELNIAERSDTSE